MEAYSWEGCWENIIELLLPEFPASLIGSKMGCYSRDMCSREFIRKVVVFVVGVTCWVNQIPRN